MAEELTTKDQNKPTDFVGKLKEKIKLEFADLVPDEEWDRLIKEEIESFFKPSESSVIFLVDENTSWQNKKTEFKLKFQGKEVSPFKRMVYEFCFRKSLEQLQSEITEEFFKNQFDEEGKEAGVRALIKEMAPVLMVEFFAGTVQAGMLPMEQRLIQLRQDLQNNGLNINW